MVFPDLSMCGLDSSLMKTADGTFDYALASTVTGNQDFIDQIASQTTAPTLTFKSKMCDKEGEVLHEFDDNSGGMLTPGEIIEIASKHKYGEKLQLCTKLMGCESKWCS